MIEELIKILTGALSAHSLEGGPISHLGGLAFTQSFVGKGDNNKDVTYAYPLMKRPPDPNCEECKNKLYLVPDAKKRCIVWFTGTDYIPTKRGKAYFASVNISFYCWYNADLFDGMPQRSLISKFNKSIVSAKSNRAVSPVNTLATSLIKVEENDINSFREYSYRNTNPETFVHPFYFFKLNYKINFVYDDNCRVNTEQLDGASCC